MRVVMITGDHPATAMAIAHQAGIAGADGGWLSGDELRGMDDDGLRQRLAHTTVFCRIAPEQKLRLVQAFRSCGEIVAMTGDGVNDAPALKAADIGVAMGARGTDVAREAAALVLLGDDFSSLLTAVRHGRRLFANLRKALAFIVAVHVPIVGLSILPVAAGWPMLLMPVHILFLQLIIDPACSIVFEAEPIEADAMTGRPRSRDSHLFDREILIRGLLQGGGLLALLAGLYLQVRWASGSDAMARTAAFVALVCSNLGLIHANCSWRQATWKRAAAANPYFIWGSLGTLLFLLLVLSVAPLRTLFAFVVPGIGTVLGCVLVALLGIAWFETVKFAMSRLCIQGRCSR
jgi:Ca2+-transporting ATPase